ncbi:MAG: hypothetical protein Q4C12_08715, partial [Clostridia bacterium]|nr:hypothetical protein [Clostridia bacterium]
MLFSRTNHIKRTLAAFLCIMMFLPSALGIATAENEDVYDVTLTKVDNSLSDSLVEDMYKTSGVAISSGGVVESIDDEEIVRAVITLDEPALLSYEEAATNTKGSFAATISAKISDQQTAVLGEIEDALGDSFELLYTYSRVINGFAARL